MKFTNLIILLTSLLLLGCGEKSYYLSCDGTTYNNYYDYKTDDEIKIKAKSFSDDTYLVIKKSILGYSINNMSCKKGNYESLFCGDDKCFMSSAIKFSDNQSCKDRMWMHTTFDLVNGNLSDYRFYPTKNNEYNIVQKEFNCIKTKKIIED
jgi:hypothetical protein